MFRRRGGSSPQHGNQEYESLYMNPWVISTFTGAGLGCLLYCCVRLRMHFGPKVRQRYGDKAREILWLLIIIGMILLANTGLRLLRYFITSDFGTNAPLVQEGWFALVALFVGFMLVYKRINRKT